MYTIKLCRKREDTEEWVDLETLPKKFSSIENAKEWLRKEYRSKHLFGSDTDLYETDRDDKIINRYRIVSDSERKRELINSTPVKCAVVENKDDTIDFWGIFKDRESAEFWMNKQFHPIFNKEGKYDAYDLTFDIIELVNEGHQKWQ